jgi:cytoskeletal protein RodZ
MARWLAPLCGVLLAVLAVHGLVLWSISLQLQAIISVIQAVPDPIFARQITQQGSASTAPASIPADATAKAQAAAPTKRPTPAAPSSMGAITATAATPTTAQATQTSVTLADSTPQADTQTVAISITTATATVTQTTDTSTTVTDPLGDAQNTLTQIGTWPSDTRLSYQLGGYFRGQLYGSAQVQWSRPSASTATAVAGASTPSVSDRYQVRMTINVGPFTAQMTSQGRIRADGLWPMAYEEQLPSGGRRSAMLDADGVVLHNGKRLPRPALEPDAVQDTASQFVDLGHRFAQGRARLVPGETVRVWLARPGGLDEWIYDIGQPETLYLPTLGAVQAYHLKPRPLPNARGTITAEMWIAPSLQHLPVRVKVTLNSETHVDLLVKTIEQR